MPFSGQRYDPQTLAILTRALDTAWHDFRALAVGYSEADLSVTRRMMALAIMVAANKGEREPQRLKEVALLAVGRRECG